jgi:hypothetical protein
LLASSSNGPHARICIRGRANFVEFNGSYPEGRSLKLDR